MFLKGICGQRRSRSDYASAQSKKGLCCPFMYSTILTDLCRVYSFTSSLDRSISKRRVSGEFFIIITMFYRNSCINRKRCRPRSDATFCGVRSGSTLFANVPFCRPSAKANGDNLGMSVRFSIK